MQDVRRPSRSPLAAPYLQLTFKIMECIYLENSVRKAVNVHALPIFTVLDHHNRRERGKDRVIGMLMGIVGSNGIVEGAKAARGGNGPTLNPRDAHSLIPLVPAPSSNGRALRVPRRKHEYRDGD